MKNEEWIALLRGVPEDVHPALVLQLLNGTEVCLDTVVEYLPQYFAFRGRMGGTTDEGRAFFIPWQQILFIRWEGLHKLAEIQRLCGVTVTATSSFLENEALGISTSPPPAPTPQDSVPAQVIETSTATPNPNALMDTKSILEKIRAMRAGTTQPAPRPRGK